MESKVYENDLWPHPARLTKRWIKRSKKWMIWLIHTMQFSLYVLFFIFTGSKSILPKRSAWMLDSATIILQYPISVLYSTWIALRVGLFGMVQISLYRREICAILWNHAGSSTSWICVCQLIMPCSFSVLWCSKDMPHCVDLQNIFLFVCYFFPWFVSSFLQSTIIDNNKGICTQHCMVGGIVADICFSKIGWGNFR